MSPLVQEVIVFLASRSSAAEKSRSAFHFRVVLYTLFFFLPGCAVTCGTDEKGVFPLVLRLFLSVEADASMRC